MMKYCFIIWFLISLLLCFVIPAKIVMAGTVEEGTASSLDPVLIEQIAASVVRLEVYDESGERIGSGSGFAALEPNVLITACHVIVNMEYMIATRDDGTVFRIDRVINADEISDVALCALPEDAGLTALSLAFGLPMRGEPVAAIGSQFGLLNLVTLGNVCGIWHTEETDRILFTAPVSAGNSGGPLINEKGLVTGIVTGTYDKGQNLNIAAPAEAALSCYRSNPF